MTGNRDRRNLRTKIAAVAPQIAATGQLDIVVGCLPMPTMMPRPVHSFDRGSCTSTSTPSCKGGWCRGQFETLSALSGRCTVSRWSAWSCHVRAKLLRWARTCDCNGLPYNFCAGLSWSELGVFRHSRSPRRNASSSRLPFRVVFMMSIFIALTADSACPLLCENCGDDLTWVIFQRLQNSANWRDANWGAPSVYKTLGTPTSENHLRKWMMTSCDDVLRPVLTTHGQPVRRST